MVTNVITEFRTLIAVTQFFTMLISECKSPWWFAYELWAKRRLARTMVAIHGSVTNGIQNNDQPKTPAGGRGAFVV